MTRVLWFQPRPWALPRRGADVRTQGLIETAVATGHDVMVVSPGSPDAAAPTLGASHVALDGHPSPVMWAATKVASRHPLRAPRATRASTRRCRELIRSFAPDIVVVSEVMSWSLAASLSPPGTPLVYDAHNVEKVLYRELSDHASGLWDSMTTAVDARRVERAEAALFRRAAVVMAVSAFDAEAFAGLYRAPARLHVVPSSVPTPAHPADPARAPRTSLFVGSLDYEPNVLAVTELVVDVLPAVRAQAPDATLTVVGRGASPNLRRLVDQTPGATLREDVDDLVPLYSGARSVVIPIRSGGGTKLKAFEALAFGVPMVCTTETVKGIDILPGEALVSDSTDDLVADLLRLLDDPVLAGTIGAAGRRGFAERLSWDAVRRPLDEALHDATRLTQ